jgi:hypothetical protein
MALRCSVLCGDLDFARYNAVRISPETSSIRDPQREQSQLHITSRAAPPNLTEDARRPIAALLQGYDMPVVQHEASRSVPLICNAFMLASFLTGARV